MSTPKRPGKKMAAKKAKIIKDLVPKKNPKGGPSPKTKRVVVLQSSVTEP
jgi:hypothetical protein